MHIRNGYIYKYECICIDVMYRHEYLNLTMSMYKDAYHLDTKCINAPGFVHIQMYK